MVPSTWMVHRHDWSCAVQRRTKKSRGILAKRGKKNATPQHMAQQPQQLELRALLQRRARENGGWQMPVLLGQVWGPCMPDPRVSKEDFSFFKEHLPSDPQQFVCELHVDKAFRRAFERCFQHSLFPHVVEWSFVVFDWAQCPACYNPFALFLLALLAQPCPALLAIIRM